METSVSEKTVIINGILTTYYFASNNRNKTAVFLHGWGTDNRVWFPLLPALDKQYDCYFPDLPGFGKSERPNPPYDIYAYAGFAAGFLKKLNLPSVNLVGHSFGGSVAAVAAAHFPDRIKTLVLVDSAGIRRNSTAKSFKHTLAKLVKPIFTPEFMQPVRKRIYTLMGAEDYLAVPQMQDTYRKIISQDITGDLHLIKLPTRIIWGGNDTDTPPSDAEIFHTRIKSSRLTVIDGAGHMVFSDQPDAFIEALSKL